MSDIQGRNNCTPKAQKFTIDDFNRMFPDDAACLEWLRDYLYPEGMFCKLCDRATKHHRDARRPSFSCDQCGHHEHPTAGTIFHKSPTPLRLWFYATYLMASTRCGISAKQIQRETGVTYKTAWRMFKQIRSMLAEDAETTKVGGNVEVDEMYHGGKRKNGTGRPMVGDKTKTPVMGMVERRGRVVARVIPDCKSRTLLENVKEYVLPASTVYTDELKAYHGIGNMTNGYNHHRINHSQGVYVMGEIHTNSVEGFWSLIKRGIGGTYHAVSAKYLQEYLNEYSFRYNHRKDEQPMFITFLQQVAKAEAPQPANT